MNRDYHLSFCTVCTKNKKDLKKGLICSLTNEIADFKDDCPSFEVDHTILEKYRERFRQEVSERFPEDFFQELFVKAKFIQPSKSRSGKYRSTSKTHNLKFKNNVIYDRSVLILMCLGMVYIFFVNYRDIVNSTVDDGILIGLGIMFGLVCLFTYRSFFMKFKAKISTDKYGIKYFGNYLYWNNVVDFGIIKARGSNFNEHIVLIGTITRGVVEIELATLNIKPEDLADIILLNAQNLIGRTT